MNHRVIVNPYRLICGLPEWPTVYLTSRHEDSLFTFCICCNDQHTVNPGEVMRMAVPEIGSWVKRRTIVPSGTDLDGRPTWRDDTRCWFEKSFIDLPCGFSFNFNVTISDINAQDHNVFKNKVLSCLRDVLQTLN